MQQHHNLLKNLASWRTQDSMSPTFCLITVAQLATEIFQSAQFVSGNGSLPQNITAAPSLPLFYSCRLVAPLQALLSLTASIFVMPEK